MAEEFPKIIYGKFKLPVNAVAYCIENGNKIIIDVSPRSFRAEYEFYGFRGLVRSLTATVIHELSHWATKSMSGHSGKATLRNLFRTRNLLQCDLWTLRIHSVLYDLQRKDSCRTYF